MDTIKVDVRLTELWHLKYSWNVTFRNCCTSRRGFLDQGRDGDSFDTIYAGMYMVSDCDDRQGIVQVMFPFRNTRNKFFFS